MGALGIWQWVIVLAIVLLLFGGRGKISSLMGDFGKGLKSFKKGMKEETDAIADDDSSETANVQAAKAVDEQKEGAAKG